MPYCVLRYCRNNSRNSNKCTGVTFHRFPRPSHENRENWIKFVQDNRSEEAWLPTNHSYLCSLHFRDEDKYVTKTGRHFLKKSAVPFDTRDTGVHEILEPISEHVSESESVLDSPRKIVLKRKIGILTLAKQKLSNKIKKVQRQNRNLKRKCESLLSLVKSLKTKFPLDAVAEKNLLAKAELAEIRRRKNSQK